jgi:integrase
MSNQLSVTNHFDIDISIFKPGYQPAIKAFLAWIQGSPEAFQYETRGEALKACIQLIDGFLREEIDRKPATIGLHRVALKQWLITALHAEFNQPVRALIDQEYRNVRKVERDKSVRPGKYLKRFEVEQLIRDSPRRYSLIIKTLFVTGLRVSELCGILLFNCTSAGDHVDVTIIGKRSKERTVQIPTRLFNELREFFKGSVYLFETKNGKRYDRRNVYNEIRRHGEKIVGRKVTPHMMRHSIATYLINDKNINLGAVSKMLGHSRQSLTADLYCHGLPDFSLIFDPVTGDLK